MIEAVPNNNLGGQVFFNAGTTQNGPRVRGLMTFNLAGEIPVSAVITSADLVMEVTGQPVDGFAASNFELRRVLRPWGEGSQTAGPDMSPGLGQLATFGEATWNHRFAGTTETWSVPGGAIGVDFSPVISADHYIYGTADSPYHFASTPELVADVQFWLDHPDQNFGWMLRTQSEATRFTARRFGSRESDLAPLLYLNYEAVPEPGTLALITLGLVGFGIRRRIL